MKLAKLIPTIISTGIVLATAPMFSSCGMPIVLEWKNGDPLLLPIQPKQFAQGEGIYPDVPTFFEAYYAEIVKQPAIYSEDLVFYFIHNYEETPDAMKVSLASIGEFYETCCFRASVTLWLTGKVSEDISVTNRMFQFNNLYINPSESDDMDFDVYMKVSKFNLQNDTEWSVNMPEMVLNGETIVGVKDNNKTYDLRTLQELGPNYLEVITSAVSQMATFGSIYFINASLEE